jgi:hypothetical protein
MAGDPHLWFQADYGCRSLSKETQPGRNLDYWALGAGYKLYVVSFVRVRNGLEEKFTVATTVEFMSQP